jgi:hypothetical protein
LLLFDLGTDIRGQQLHLDSGGGTAPRLFSARVVAYDFGLLSRILVYGGLDRVVCQSSNQWSWFGGVEGYVLRASYLHRTSWVYYIILLMGNG